MIHLYAFKKLECGCIFHAYINYSHYKCRGTFWCNNCTFDELEENADLLKDEFNNNFPSCGPTDYTKLIPLGWIEVEKTVYQNDIHNDDFAKKFRFCEDDDHDI
jgi:hypothetical protein